MGWIKLPLFTHPFLIERVVTARRDNTMAVEEDGGPAQVTTVVTMRI